MPRPPEPVCVSAPKSESTLDLSGKDPEEKVKTKQVNKGATEARLPALHAIQSHHSTIVDFHPPTYPQGRPPPPPAEKTPVVATAGGTDGSGSDSDLEAATAVVSPDDDDDAQYDRFSTGQKAVILAVISWCGLLSPVSSTAILAAIPEVAASYHTAGSMISLSNALYLAFMGVSPAVFGPVSQVYGRRLSCITIAALFFVASVGTALSPNLGAFFFFRILTAFSGTAFLLLGPAVVGDIYRPVERGTGMTWFLLGPLIGPTICPFISGVIITYTTWPAIFWMQTGLATLGVIGTVFLLPETLPAHRLTRSRLHGLAPGQKALVLWKLTNPFRVMALMKYPNLLLTALASSALIWTQYSLLTPIRYVLNPRFELTSPVLSGLFYCPLGVGFVIGVLGGGRLADWCVRRWIRKCGGERVPEHRLYSCVPFLIALLPVSMLVYGWSVETAVGGIPLPVAFMVLQGIGQMYCFPSLNTYCLDVNHERSAEIVSANFMVRYVFGAIGSAVVLPAIQAIGVGWFNTITAGLLLIGGLATWATARWGMNWRKWVDG